MRETLGASTLSTYCQNWEHQHGIAPEKIWQEHVGERISLTLLHSIGRKGCAEGGLDKLMDHRANDTEQNCKKLLNSRHKINTVASQVRPQSGITQNQP